MLNLYADYRIGGIPRYYLADKPDHLMLVPDEVRKCAAFVGYKTSDGSMRKLGTAFFVHLAVDEDHTFSYVVTAKHIIAKIKQKQLAHAYLRVNTSDGFRWLRTKIDDWRFHPDDYVIDVAVLAASIPPDVYDYLAIPFNMAATADVITKWNVGVGNEVFLTDLFSEHMGRKKNLPIVRTGNIALMPDEPVEVNIMGVRQEMDAILIEARSIGGLSGSPVFVYMTERHVSPNLRKLLDVPNRFYWLGLVHGHWDVGVKPDDDEQDDSSIPAEERVNMGIAIVVPVSKIIEVINQPEIEDERRRVIEDERKKHLPTPDNTDEDETPYTKADFERDLDRAMRRDDEKPDPKSSGTSE